MANGIRLGRLRKQILRERVDVYNGNIVEALKEACPKGTYHTEFVDRKYTAVSESCWKDILQHTSINKRKYQSEVSDCDDFAYALRGIVPLQLKVNGIGLVLDSGRRHAYNVILIARRRLDGSHHITAQFVEPQTDQFVNHTEIRGLIRF